MKISYQRFWDLLKEKGLNQYILINKFGVRSSLLYRLRHNMDLRLSTLMDLCEMLDCELNDIVEFVKEKQEV